MKKLSLLFVLFLLACSMKTQKKLRGAGVASAISSNVFDEDDSGALDPGEKLTVELTGGNKNYRFTMLINNEPVAETEKTNYFSIAAPTAIGEGKRYVFTLKANVINDVLLQADDIVTMRWSDSAGALADPFDIYITDGTTRSLGVEAFEIGKTIAAIESSIAIDTSTFVTLTPEDADYQITALSLTNTFGSASSVSASLGNFVVDSTDNKQINYALKNPTATLATQTIDTRIYYRVCLVEDTTKCSSNSVLVTVNPRNTGTTPTIAAKPVAATLATTANDVSITLNAASADLTNATSYAFTGISLTGTTYATTPIQLPHGIVTINTTNKTLTYTYNLADAVLATQAIESLHYKLCAIVNGTTTTTCDDDLATFTVQAPRGSNPNTITAKDFEVVVAATDGQTKTIDFDNNYLLGDASTGKPITATSDYEVTIMNVVPPSPFPSEGSMSDPNQIEHSVNYGLGLGLDFTARRNTTFRYRACLKTGANECSEEKLITIKVDPRIIDVLLAEAIDPNGDPNIAAAASTYSFNIRDYLKYNNAPLGSMPLSSLRFFEDDGVTELTNARTDYGTLSAANCVTAPCASDRIYTVRPEVARNVLLTDTFKYKACVANICSNVATVNLTIAPVPTAPDITAQNFGVTVGYFDSITQFDFDDLTNGTPRVGTKNASDTYTVTVAPLNVSTFGTMDAVDLAHLSRYRLPSPYNVATNATTTFTYHACVTGTTSCADAQITVIILGRVGDPKAPITKNIVLSMGINTSFVDFDFKKHILQFNPQAPYTIETPTAAGQMLTGAMTPIPGATDTTLQRYNYTSVSVAASAETFKYQACVMIGTVKTCAPASDVTINIAKRLTPTVAKPIMVSAVTDTLGTKQRELLINVSNYVKTYQNQAWALAITGTGTKAPVRGVISTVNDATNTFKYTLNANYNFSTDKHDKFVVKACLGSNSNACALVPIDILIVPHSFNDLTARDFTISVAQAQNSTAINFGQFVTNAAFDDYTIVLSEIDQPRLGGISVLTNGSQVFKTATYGVNSGVSRTAELTDSFKYKACFVNERTKCSLEQTVSVQIRASGANLTLQANPASISLSGVIGGNGLSATTPLSASYSGTYIGNSGLDFQLAADAGPTCPTASSIEGGAFYTRINEGFTSGVCKFTVSDGTQTANGEVTITYEGLPSAEFACNDSTGAPLPLTPLTQTMLNGNSVYLPKDNYGVTGTLTVNVGQKVSIATGSKLCGLGTSPLLEIKGSINTGCADPSVNCERTQFIGVSIKTTDPAKDNALFVNFYDTDFLGSPSVNLTMFRVKDFIAVATGAPRSQILRSKFIASNVVLDKLNSVWDNYFENTPLKIVTSSLTEARVVYRISRNTFYQSIPFILTKGNADLLEVDNLVARAADNEIVKITGNNFIYDPRPAGSPHQQPIHLLGKNDSFDLVGDVGNKNYFSEGPYSAENPIDPLYFLQTYTFRLSPAPNTFILNVNFGAAASKMKFNTNALSQTPLAGYSLNYFLDRQAELSNEGE